MAVHACVSCWKQTSTAYRQTIIDTLYSSPSRFLKEWPADVTASLRKLTSKADIHCIPLQWEAFGAKIVTYVSGRDPVFAQNLAQFGPSGSAYAEHRDLNDSASLTDQLFAVIDTCCQEVKAVDTSKGANSIRISDPKIKRIWQDKVLDGKGSKTGDRDKSNKDRPWIPKSERGLTRINKDSLRCEALMCENDVSHSGQVVCRDCHVKSHDKPVRLIGKDRVYKANNKKNDHKNDHKKKSKTLKGTIKGTLRKENQSIVLIRKIRKGSLVRKK